MLCVTKFDYIFSAPARGDVVVCRYPNRKALYQAHSGSAGRYCHDKDGRTYVNDELVDESFVSYPAESDYGPVLIGNGQYLVMGDNRAVSHDSRADDVGTLKADYIIGHARSVVYPLSDIHGI